ncbi:hypothetical protein BaRGS_00008924 [Batillaria attramentaria]|uniref:Uncharacterized protein n=1 Tax=Batillaria attramentaria TaxID=370345 RepID=A0ABD0LLE9_9CAEN
MTGCVKCDHSCYSLTDTMMVLTDAAGRWGGDEGGGQSCLLRCQCGISVGSLGPIMSGHCATESVSAGLVSTLSVMGDTGRDQISSARRAGPAETGVS